MEGKGKGGEIFMGRIKKLEVEGVGEGVGFRGQEKWEEYENMGVEEGRGGGPDTKMLKQLM